MKSSVQPHQTITRMLLAALTVLSSMFAKADSWQVIAPGGWEVVANPAETRAVVDNVYKVLLSSAFADCDVKGLENSPSTPAFFKKGSRDLTFQMGSPMYWTVARRDGPQPNIKLYFNAEKTNVSATPENMFAGHHITIATDPAGRKVQTIEIRMLERSETVGSVARGGAVNSYKTKLSLICHAR